MTYGLSPPRMNNWFGTVPDKRENEQATEQISVLIPKRCPQKHWLLTLHMKVSELDGFRYDDDERTWQRICSHHGWTRPRVATWPPLYENSSRSPVHTRPRKSPTPSIKSWRERWLMDRGSDLFDRKLLPVSDSQDNIRFTAGADLCFPQKHSLRNLF